MSSILDAVTKDSARSGGVPGVAGTAPPAGGGGPGRLRSAALVVVFGVAVGALAARMFGGGGEPPADDMLTEKVDRGADAQAKSEGKRGRIEGEGEKDEATGGEAAKGSRKDEAAHQRFIAKKKEMAAASADKAKAPEPVVVPAPVGSLSAPPPAVAGAPNPLPVAGVPPPAAPVIGGPPPAAAIVAGPPPAVIAAAPPPNPSAKIVDTARVVTGAAPASPPARLEPLSDEEADMEVAAATPPDPPSPPAEAAISEERPSGAPEVSILFVAWSHVPAERIVSMRVAAGTLNVVHEGEYVEGLQVSTIHPEAVDLSWTGQKFRVAIVPF